MVAGRGDVKKNASPPLAHQTANSENILNRPNPSHNSSFPLCMLRPKRSSLAFPSFISSTMEPDAAAPIVGVCVYGFFHSGLRSKTAHPAITHSYSVVVTRTGYPDALGITTLSVTRVAFCEKCRLAVLATNESATVFASYSGRLGDLSAALGRKSVAGAQFAEGTALPIKRDYFEVPGTKRRVLTLGGRPRERGLISKGS